MSDPVVADDSQEELQAHHAGGSLTKLVVGAVGVVFGDIGTSPIYAFRETFVGHHRLIVDQAHIYGVLSLIFWSMMIVVTFKYVTIIMRADNKGEGGSLALLALINRHSEGARWSAPIVLLGVFATALFYGDSMITPAMSVLSASEGLAVVNSGFGPWVVPLSVGILVGLFTIQSRGTATVGAFFGPIMLLYFGAIAVLGTIQIVGNPGIAWALNPYHAVAFFIYDPTRAFLALGSVVLAITGAEALYADMGHFGRKPIGISWLWFVMPALMLNYLGQGAMIISNPAAIANPFFLLAPDSIRIFLVLLAMLASIIASQAVISGA
ncbi:MAG: KUP/HAK/KT family potassium transporter, partial [Sphingomonadales bacterium]|nr:KUP/HAK/KT family potassium transporter [Sphingomonadales bacterium]